MSEIRELFFETEVSEKFEDAIEIMETRLLDFSNKNPDKKEYILNQKNMLENLKDYFLKSQHYIAQLERKAPINNFFSWNENRYENNDKSFQLIKNENIQLKKQVENYKRVLEYHNIFAADVAFLNARNFDKEFIRQASINKLRNDSPNLF